MYLQESERSIYSGGDYQSVILLQSFILIFLFLFAQFSQQIVGRSKEKRSCYSCAEVKQTIGIPYRIADEHTFQHLPGRTERTCITDEVCAIFSLRRIGKRHVGTYNFQVITNISDGIMRILRFLLVRQLDIVKLTTPITFSCSSTGRAFHATIS